MASPQARMLLRWIGLVAAWLATGVWPLPAAAGPRPVNPQACAESHEVLAYLTRERDAGRILSGQQSKTTWGARAGEDFLHVHALTDPAVYPAIFGFDLGSNSQQLREHQIPIARARDDMVACAIAWWSRGALVTLSWHQTNPQDPEPDRGGFPSCQSRSKMSDAQFREVVTPGTDLHARWLAHVDLIAPYLQRLRDAGVVVLWRPYHEMNGDWFWWCARPGADYLQLWRNLYDRLVRHHGLNNLLWVWAPSMTNNEVGALYPGFDYVDISGVDLYDANPAAARYTAFPAQLEQAAPGKPYALTECGRLPEENAIRSSRYLWFLPWHGVHLDRDWSTPGYPANPSLEEGNTADSIRTFYRYPFTLTLDEISFPRSPEAELVRTRTHDGARAFVTSLPDAANGAVLELTGISTLGGVEISLPVPHPGSYRVTARVRHPPAGLSLRLVSPVDANLRNLGRRETAGNTEWSTLDFGQITWRSETESFELNVAAPKPGDARRFAIDFWTLTPIGTEAD